MGAVFLVNYKRLANLCLESGLRRLTIQPHCLSNSKPQCLLLQLGCLISHLVFLHVSFVLILTDQCFTPEPPSSITIEEFILSGKYGRQPAATSRNPFTCGLTGKSFTATQVPQRINFLARGLAQALNIEPNKGLSLDKVIAIFSPNTVWIYYADDFLKSCTVIAKQEP